MEWDHSIKDIILKEQDDSVEIFDMIIKSPGFFISERDIVDKRIHFFHEGIYYNFCSSIDEHFEPPHENIVRCKTFLNIFIFAEDKDYFYFLGFSQLDIKVYPILIIN